MARTKGHPRRFILPTDYISGLPDHLLIIILSFLPTDQAARTNILSSRWNRNLWKFNHTLDFNFQNNPYLLSPVVCILISLHLNPTCQELRVRLSDTDEEAMYHVKRWFSFVSNKSVERLELHLPVTDYPVLNNASLNFPELDFAPTNALKYLCIHSKSVESYDIAYILATCPNLEELRIHGSYRVNILTIYSESLKKLEIVNCCLLSELRLFANNLVSFKYGGPDLEISFDHVPLLNEVSFLDTYCRMLAVSNFKQFFPVLKQLQTVKLSMGFPWISYFPPVKKLKNLQNFELDIVVWNFVQTFGLICSLMEALPNLNKLKIHFFWPENYECSNESYLFSKDHKHYGLKEVELVGFTGGVVDLEIADYIIKNAIWLETLIVQVCKEASIEDAKDLMEYEEKIEALWIAEDLQVDLSSWTKLEVRGWAI